MWQIAIMIKTQITVPDELYHKAKEIAKAKEWSLAEVFRRGLEYMAETHTNPIRQESWSVPEIACGNTPPISAEELKNFQNDMRDEFLLSKLKA
jgi:hypothetical protein